MGRVTESLPITLNDVKSGYGVGGSALLRSFLAGGSYANTNTATINGTWLPASGTIKLTDLRGATNLNVTFSGTNTIFSADSSDYGYGGAGAYAESGMYLYANGALQIYTIGNTSGSGSPAEGVISNSWLLRQAGDCSAAVTQMYEVLFVKTGGSTSGVGFSSNNAWVRLGTSTITQQVGAGASGDSSLSRVIKGRMKIRRYSDGTELANVYVEFSATAVSSNNPEP